MVAIPLLFSASATFFSSAFHFREFLVASWSAYGGASVGLLAAAFLYYTWPLTPITTADLQKRRRIARVLLIVGIPLLLVWGYLWFR
jgi:hypothetical protein